MNFPDIEIYIKDLKINEINAWLGTSWGVSSTSKIGTTAVVQLCNAEQEIECRILEDAVEPGFTSICFSPNKTKWETDLQCARDAFNYFQLEARCSTGGWNENSIEDEDWFKINSDGIHRIKW